MSAHNSWPIEHEQKLIELWNQKMSASEISKIIGYSRSSILGKANRLKLGSRETIVREVIRTDVPRPPIFKWIRDLAPGEVRSSPIPEDWLAS